MPGTLTPLQLIAGASLLQNQGLSVSAALTAASAEYSATPLMTAFFEALALYPSLATLAANTCPAFSNSIANVTVDYSSLGTQMTTAIEDQAVIDLGSGDLSKFAQALNSAQAYGQNTNTFVNSAVNSQTYLANTFTNTNNMITGDITNVNLATQAFGRDLARMGFLIDLDNLNDLGSPLALIQRLVSLTGNIPILAVAFIAEGVPQEVVVELTNPGLTVQDNIQKLMYQALTKISGDSLTQILKVLRITTTGINTMADLLNPVKLFPNSYQSLTCPTANGLRAIYIDNSGTVNSGLATELPAYVTRATA